MSEIPMFPDECKPHGWTTPDCPLCERDALRAENARLRAVLARLADWTHAHGAELKPPRADTYGEGVRDSKERVARILEVPR